VIALYLCVAIVVLMIAYAGVEATLRVFAYIDITLRWQWVRLRMYFMKKRLERDLMVYKNGEWKSFNEVQNDDRK
jgi:hypothetical protein